MVLAEEFSRLENSVNLSESRVWPLSKFCPMPLALFAIIERQLKKLWESRRVPGPAVDSAELVTSCTTISFQMVGLFMTQDS